MLINLIIKIVKIYIILSYNVKHCTYIHIIHKSEPAGFFFADDIPTVRITSEYRMALKNLYPGGSYQLKVFAISHGLLSEPHDYFQAVCKYSL